MDTEIAQFGLWRKHVPGHRLWGHQNLPTPSRRQQPGGAIDDRAEEVLPSAFGVASMKRHPHAEFAQLAPGLTDNLTLYVEGAEDGVARLENGENAIPRVFDDAST